jgi:hypothetical protein
MRKTIKPILFLLAFIPAFPGLSVNAQVLSTAKERRVQCLGNGELDASVVTLKSYLAGPELDNAAGLLLRKARRSPKCRAQIIQALITAMSHITHKEPPLRDLGVDEETYYLWQNGANLFAKLHATEALDLLLANLALTDGWSISMSHYPAVAAVTGIGLPAIPKLEFVLHNNSQPYMRKFAIFCIASIGGAKARSALSKAVRGETDPCVKRFVRVSLEVFRNKSQPNHVTATENGRWSSAFYCLPE